ncbi:Cof-type HAD-IIB family hydrolase [Paenibacillus crassostreae]|uniref:Hydrolase Cof n=1 Tax=Paenibacillus crassostreae TaxID=1763538 RepID=A0A162N7P4_9BACL|nr:Cof-type HAD-IIB family hydrolase [Paenibacillus crassostreae]AOZ93707.1 hypothetical protein LPB68_16930 [Paenibacillus crassostreae]OAB71242.1 hypothetical protein PNBC_19800 [Paenibacillus crassostreae]
MINTRRMIFFDVDGTLLDQHQRLPSSTKNAIKALQRDGHEIAIASGRSPFMIDDLAEELQIDSYVGFNGQYVILKGELIYHNPIESELLSSFSQFAIGNHHPLVYLNQESMRSNILYHSRIETCIAVLQHEHPKYDPQFHINRKIYQAMLFCTEDEELNYRNHFKGLEFVRWHPYAMDVLPAGGSKAIGIAQLIAKLGFSPDEVYAFGDNLNDIEMFRYVGNSVAMGNSPVSLKRLAQFVTTDVDQDGIANGLRMMGLIL